MSFWRKDVIEFALDQDTERLIAEQKEWIAREPLNAQPYYHLAELLRLQHKQDEALALLLHAVALAPALTDGHLSLTEIYAVRADYAAAWRHAQIANASGEPRGVELLNRYGIAET